MQPRVFIIILNWNGWQDTLECLDSLKKIDYPNYQVVVVDNGSSKKFSISNFQFSNKIEFIFNKKNLGFSGGNNIGIKYALENGADYVLLLNNDTIVAPDFLSELVKASEQNPKAGLLGSKIYFYDKPNVIWFAGGKVNWLYNKGTMRGFNELDKGQYDEPAIQPSDYISGCCLLIKKEVIDKIGLMPEDYFLYYEDTDWSLATQRAGFECVFVPGSKIWHKGSKSSVEFSSSYIYYHVRNGLIFANKYAPWHIKPFVHLDALWRIKKQFLKLIFLPSKRAWTKPILSGIKDFYSGKRGSVQQNIKIGIDAKNMEGQRTGVGRYLINILQEWDKIDLSDLEFILYFQKEIPADLNLTKLNYKAKILPFGRFSNAFFMHFILPLFAYKDNLDILFCPAYVSPIWYFKKTALTLHDIIYEARPELYNWPSIFDKILLKKFSRISAKRAKIIFVPSEYSKKEVIECYGVNPDKVFVTLLGIDEILNQADDEDKISHLKKELNIKDKFILFIGSISNRRHLSEVIKAFEKIADKLTNYQFLVVGKNITSPFVDIDGLAQQVNGRLGRQVILRKDYFPGKDLGSLYKATDLLVWLSDYEGFGLPVLETLACGTPVITSPVTSIPEVADKAAIYIQSPNNIDEIFQAIYKGLTDEQLRQNLIQKGLEQAKKFSWRNCAKKTLDNLLV